MKTVSIIGDEVKLFINVLSVKYINIKVYNYINIKGDIKMTNMQKIIDETKVLAAIELFKQVAVDLCDTGDEELADILYRGVKILEIGCESKRITNKDLTEELASTLHSDCGTCDEKGIKQNFTVTDSYIDDGQGVFPLIYCHNCQETMEAGDGDFHTYYKIINNDYVVRKEK